MSKSTPAEADQNGWIDVPHHDGDLLGVVVEEPNCLLAYRSTDGVRRGLRLVGVHSMDLSGFRQGNIIMSMMMFSPEVAPKRLSEAQWLRLGHGGHPRLKGRYVFLLDSSYGAELVADCDDIEVLPPGDTVAS